MLELTPLVEPVSIDEAFLDLSGTERLHHASPAVTLVRFAQRVETEIGITVSVGLSHNKFLAKIASDLDKPRGFSIIGRAETAAVLADRPVADHPRHRRGGAGAAGEAGITHLATCASAPRRRSRPAARPRRRASCVRFANGEDDAAGAPGAGDEERLGRDHLRRRPRRLRGAAGRSCGVCASGCRGG